MSEEVIKDLKQNLKASHKWLRGLWMLLFSVVAYCVLIFAFVIVVFQFVTQLFTNEVNARLCKFGQSLGAYIYLILQYITYETDQKPFPFDEWPPAKTKKSPAKTKDVKSD